MYATIDGVKCEVQLVDRVDGYMRVRDPRGVVMHVALTDLPGDEEAALSTAKEKDAAEEK